MTHATYRDYLNQRVSQLELERQSFISHWKELSVNISPRRGRFEQTDRNIGTKRHKAIINSRGTQALGTARAGMFAGVMSPTRPWFEIGVPDPELSNSTNVRIWSTQVEAIMLEIFNTSNLYSMAPVMLGELLLFGTGCMTHVDDDENVARFYTHTAGSYMVSQNDKFEVDTLVREFMMTAEQMIEEFGMENLSIEVERAIEQHELHSWFNVRHLIEPNKDYKPDNPLSKFKKFISVKYEPGNNDKSKLLSISGFDEFPAYVPRWALTGEDVYGTDSPGMITLGDVKGLQIQEKRKAQALDKMVSPPLVGPASIRNTTVASIPGGLTLYDGDPTRTKLEPLYAVNLALGELIQDMDRTERRINEAFFVDLFLAITDMEGIQPRNELEISERRAESLLQLGPVLESIQGDFLDNLISRTFNQMLRAGLVPPAPPEIQGQPIKVRYISSLALAQRAVDTRPIQALASFTASLVGSGLSDGKKFNGDAAISKWAELTGAPAQLVVDDELIAEQRAQEAAIQKQQLQAELTTQLAQAAATAGTVNLDENNPVSAAVDGINRQQGQ